MQETQPAPHPGYTRVFAGNFGPRKKKFCPLPLYSRPPGCFLLLLPAFSDRRRTGRPQLGRSWGERRSRRSTGDRCKNPHPLENRMPAEEASRADSFGDALLRKVLGGWTDRPAGPVGQQVPSGPDSSFSQGGGKILRRQLPEMSGACRGTSSEWSATCLLAWWPGCPRSSSGFTVAAGLGVNLQSQFWSFAFGPSLALKDC